MASKKKMFGTAQLVALAITALRNPQVQQALKQAPTYVGKLADDVRERKVSKGDGAKAKVTEKFGQQKLEKRAADLRALVDDLGTMPVGKRIDPATVAAVTDALDAIDYELRLAAHQSLVDRKRRQRRISHDLDELVNALSIPAAEAPPAT
jgi:hypothetical protein